MGPFMFKFVGKFKRKLQGAKRRIKSILHHSKYKIKAHMNENRLVKLDCDAGSSLNIKQDNTGLIKKHSIILFCCIKNEKIIMPFFFDYYRKIGVDHFIIVDNNSNDNLMSACKNLSDVSVFHTDASYEEARLGMLWINYLLSKYGVDHWNVVVNADEFLVYPYMETRSLKSLASYLEDERRPCFHSIVLDAYSDKPLSETLLESGQNPFSVCPFFDKDGYIQTESWGGSTLIRGGPSMRTFFNQAPQSAPSLSKIPFIKWKKNYHYNNSTHNALPLELNNAHNNWEVNPTGALFRFGMLSTLDDSVEKRDSGEYSGDDIDPKRYNEMNSPEFYTPGISVKYINDSQLIQLGLISSGTWF